MKIHWFIPFLTSILSVAGAVAAGPDAPKPIIDNERVRIWDLGPDQPAPAEASTYDTVRIYLSGNAPGKKKGDAAYIRKGENPDHQGARLILIALKGSSRPAARKQVRSPRRLPSPACEKGAREQPRDRMVLRLDPGEPTPVHYHDKDVAVVYMEDTALTSTTPDGKKVLNEYKAGETRFNLRDRTHTELLARGTGSAVMMELK